MTISHKRDKNVILVHVPLKADAKNVSRTCCLQTWAKCCETGIQLKKKQWNWWVFTSLGGRKGDELDPTWSNMSWVTRGLSFFGWLNSWTSFHKRTFCQNESICTSHRFPERSCWIWGQIWVPPPGQETIPDVTFVFFQACNRCQFWCFECAEEQSVENLKPKNEGLVGFNQTECALQKDGLYITNKIYKIYIYNVYIDHVF